MDADLFAQKIANLLSIVNIIRGNSYLKNIFNYELVEDIVSSVLPLCILSKCNASRCCIVHSSGLFIYRKAKT